MGTSAYQTTETLNTACQVFTKEVTERQIQAGRPNIITSVIRANVQSLVVSTVQGDAKTSEVEVTVTATSLTTTTEIYPSTVIVTHVDTILEQTVVPIVTVITVDLVETSTITTTLTQEVTSTVY